MTDSDRLAKLRAMHASDPTDADIPYMIAQEHAKVGGLEESLALYDACLAIDPHYHYAYFHKARALEQLERIGDAASTLRDGLTVAQADGNAQAIGEIGQYLESLEEQQS